MIDLQHNRVWDWLKKNFFANPFNVVLTFLLLFVAAKLLWNFFDWAVLKAMWNADAETCRQGDGACWAYLREKARYVLFGHYPYEEQWRPQLFVVIFFLFIAVNAIQAFLVEVFDSRVGGGAFGCGGVDAGWFFRLDARRDGRVGWSAVDVSVGFSRNFRLVSDWHHVGVSTAQ